MTVLRDVDLYSRGVDTLLASWEAYARGAIGASLQRLPGVAAAVFPHQPERAFYNNALLERDLDAASRVDALDAMEAAYAVGCVARFAAWVHDTDAAMREALEARGYTRDTATRAMGLVLDDIHLGQADVDIRPMEWREYLRMFELPQGLLSGANHAEFHVMAARLDNEPVAAALAFDYGSDCGIYNVGTLERARRRGLATVLTGRQVHDARERGCQTVSLQSTAMAERVYAALGFRDLGRFLEYVPPTRGSVAE
jgi:ribosomal protein S18 acetylase RimI-like enzyme